MTAPGTQSISASCWIYNRVKAIAPAQLEEFRGSAPPTTQLVAGDQSLVTRPEASRMRFVWSDDGHSVGFIYMDVPLGFIANAQKFGYSRNLRMPSPWGNPWDEKLFRKTFGTTT